MFVVLLGLFVFRGRVVDRRRGSFSVRWVVEYWVVGNVRVVLRFRFLCEILRGREFLVR